MASIAKQICAFFRSEKSLLLLLPVMLSVKSIAAQAPDYTQLLYLAAEYTRVSGYIHK